MHSGGGSVGNKVVATLRADGNVVYPTTEASASVGQLANLLNYKIRTEGELLVKTTAAYSVPATVVDLGKQLLQCARDSDVNGVKNALARGAPFAADWLGMSALHFAALNNQLEICEILLHGGINKDAKTKADRTPLHLACFYGHEPIVQLLLSKKCAVNPRDMLRMTPLHWAVEKGHKTIVRLLLKHNADVTVVSKFGKTPLALAVLTEQAGLLAELEAARQAQANRKFNEETEKETSEAVNSIMGLSDINTNSADDTNAAGHRRLNEHNDSSESYEGAYVTADNIEVLGNDAKSAINMLKSHGIAMMQEEDDGSKDLLNTALQNGRQLVLSEGGRMLLHETQRKLHNITNGNHINNNSNGKVNNSNNNNINNDLSNNLNNNNNNNHVARIKPNVASTPQKIRMNVIKPKETSPPGVTKNKNIRIISLTDFKKLCSEAQNPKALQKIPATLASSGVVRQLTDGTKLVNMRQLQSRKLKLPSINEVVTPTPTTTTIIAEEDLTSSEKTDEKRARISNTTTSSNMRLYPAKRAEQMGTVQTLQLRPMQTTAGAGGGKVNATGKVSTRSSSYGETATVNKQPNVMPLLTPPEICRQLLELRRQNEELRRKFELAQKEKDELRQRLMRLEELVMPDGSVEELSEC